MLGKFHHLLWNLVLIVLIVSTQTGQYALAPIPALLSTPNGTTNTLFFLPGYRMWLRPAAAFTQQKPAFLLSLDFLFSLSHFIQCKLNSIPNSLKIRTHSLLCTAYSQNWPPKNLEGGRSRIIFPL